MMKDFLPKQQVHSGSVLLPLVTEVEAESQEDILQAAALDFQLKHLQGEMQDIGLRNNFFRRELLVQFPPKASKQLNLMWC